MSASSARRAAMIGFALGGVVLGHAVTYLLAIGDAGHRGAHLSEAGHGYWDAAVWVAGSLALLATAWIFLRSVRYPERGVHAEPFGRTAALLMVVQAAGFLGLEVAERLASGAPIADLLSHRLLLVGTLVQLIVAVLGALFVRWLARAAGLISSGIMPRVRRASAALPRATLAFDLSGRPLSGGEGLRGPPRPLAAQN